MGQLPTEMRRAIPFLPRRGWCQQAMADFFGHSNSVNDAGNHRSLVRRPRTKGSNSSGLVNEAAGLRVKLPNYTIRIPQPQRAEPKRVCPPLSGKLGAAEGPQHHFFRTGRFPILGRERLIAIGIGEDGQQCLERREIPVGLRR